MCTYVFHTTVPMCVLAYVHISTSLHTQMHVWHHAAHMNMYTLLLFFHPSLLSHKTQQKRGCNVCALESQISTFLSGFKKTACSLGERGGHLFFSLSHLVVLTSSLFSCLRRGQAQTQPSLLISTREERSETQPHTVQLGMMCPPRECSESMFACTPYGAN